MSWNNRIFIHNNAGEISYGVHETYYNEYDEVDGYTKDSIVGLFESLNDLFSFVKNPETDSKRYGEILSTFTEQESCHNFFTLINVDIEKFKNEILEYQ